MSKNGLERALLYTDHSLTTEMDPAGVWGMVSIFLSPSLSSRLGTYWVFFYFFMTSAFKVPSTAAKPSVGNRGGWGLPDPMGTKGGVLLFKSICVLSPCSLSYLWQAKQRQLVLKEVTGSCSLGISSFCSCC